MADKPFVPQPIRCYEWGGAASGELDPGSEAETIGARFPGAWLTAYMIRRFGPPNHGSDDHKHLCSWTITTPMPGLALLVTPYLGDQDVNDPFLHFGYRWSKRLAMRVRRDDPRLRSYRELCERAWRWQRRKIVGLYMKDAVDRKAVTVFPEWQDDDGKEHPAIGLYWAKPKGENPKTFITKKEFLTRLVVRDAIVAAYAECYPGKRHKPHKLPANGRWPVSMLVRRCNFALRAAIRALMVPVWVRDVCFSASGYLPAGCPRGQHSAEPFADAGWACRVDK